MREVEVHAADAGRVGQRLSTRWSASFPTHKAYSEATMEQILRYCPKPPTRFRPPTFGCSDGFFNRTNHFDGGWNCV